MSNLTKKSKLYIIVFAVMVLLPIYNIFAYEWEGDGDPYVYGDGTPSGYGGVPNKTYYEIDSDFDYDSTNYSNGFSFEGYAEAYTFADAYSRNSNDPYAGSINPDCEAYVGYSKDWTWSGPPGTSPGAYVNLTVGLIADHNSYAECWETEAAYLYPEGRMFNLGKHSVVDSGDSDSIYCGCLSVGYIEDDQEPWFGYAFLRYPDDSEIYLDDSGDTYYHIGLSWELLTNIDDYVVSSGISEFTTYAEAEANSESYAEIDFDGGDQYWPEAQSKNRAFLSIEALCIVEEP